jgi:GNAT superfamily N-acetyltransferase
MKKIKFYPLTLERWNDFEKLFGSNGACAGCWCTYWILKRSDFDELRKTSKTKNVFKQIVKNISPGILAYRGGEPAGWCAIQPRENYPVLQNSRILKPIDDKPVWSIVCFFIGKKYRGEGLSTLLIKEAVKFAKTNGAKIIEAYPVEPKKKTAPVFIYTGVASSFLKAGFKEAARRSETRPIMRMRV